MDTSRLIRYLVYTLELLTLYMLQETPDLFPEIFGARPVLIVPAVLSIAMAEEQSTGVLYGVAGGLLLDFGAPGKTLGFYAMILAAVCYLAGSIAQSYMQLNFGMALFTALIGSGLVTIVSWFFMFFLAGYSSPGHALVNRYLTQWAYNMLLFPLVFLMNRGIGRALRSPE